MKSLLLFCAVAFTGAQAQTPTPLLRVAAAADLQPALGPVFDAFQSKTGIHAEATFQSSATLTQQIFNGSPTDVFLAADMSYPQKLVDAQLTVQGRPVAYARGTLVLWARHDAPVLGGQPLDFAVLRNPSLTRVAIANPQQAPYGRAAQAAIAGMFLTSTLAPKLRLAANVAQAAQFADSGNAEVGFLSLTSALSPRLQADGSFLPVPKEVYPAIVQGAVSLKHAPHTDAAQRFMQFLATPEVRAILKQHGLDAPQ